MATVSDFAALMSAYDVPRNDAIFADNLCAYHDVPRKGTLAWGHDRGGRICVNLPLVIKTVTQEDTHHQHVECEDDAAMVVHQRYTDREDYFVVAGNETDAFSMYAFLGQDLTNLDALNHLLAGMTIPFQVEPSRVVQVTLKV